LSDTAAFCLDGHVSRIILKERTPKRSQWGPIRGIATKQSQQPCIELLISKTPEPQNCFISRSAPANAGAKNPKSTRSALRPTNYVKLRLAELLSDQKVAVVQLAGQAE
jgi:hypothetical protein